jgi:hypothetical protein
MPKDLLEELFHQRIKKHNQAILDPDNNKPPPTPRKDRLKTVGLLPVVLKRNRRERPRGDGR